jgi:PIN domain nuclease of toxin-antitoxin system
VNLLLDTQAFLWWIDNDRRLGVTARVALQDPGNEVVFSVVSAWEIAIKARLGHLRTPPDLGSFLVDQIAINGFRILAVELTHAVRVRHLDDHHRDPFDRLLVAQAVTEDLTLVTSDPVVSRYPVAILAARR